MDINKLFEAALKFNASDIFISCGKSPAFRITGEISFAENIPTVDKESVDTFRRNCLGMQMEKAYEETGGADVSYSLKNNRFRINFFDSVNGPCFVARPIHAGNDCDFAKLNLPVETMQKIASSERGLIIITGTTGSGKSTTMSAMINYINSTASKHILTLEDPIEYIHQDNLSIISQREISKFKGGFSEALRNALRENPDIIMVGEIRDPETLNAALSAALTGHLVISTMHTSDAAGAVERMLELFPEQQRDTIAGSLSTALVAVVAQRLITTAFNNGMIPALDILLGTGLVRKHIAEQHLGELELDMQMGSQLGMRTFNTSLIELIRNNRITAEDALKATDYPDELRLLLRGMSVGSNTAEGADSSPTVATVIDMRDLFKAAVKAGASDLLITVGVPPQLKIAGKLAPLDLPDLNGADVQRLAYSMLSHRQRTALEEKRDLDLAVSINLSDGETRRFRLNIFYQRGNLAISSRLISAEIPTPQQIGLHPILSTLMQKKQGLILVTGPTGSGKSTTLASLLNEVNHRDSRHIITIEDPIEYTYEHDRCVVEQREIGIDALNFSSGLRSAMRQAPDIIMVGELRDIETIQAALSAAETGHLVLGTLHSNNACQTVERIIDVFPAAQQNQIRQQFAGTILAIVSQRLIPRQDIPEKRVAAFEIMTGSTAVRSLIRDGKTHQLMSVIESSAKEGMLSMQACLDAYLAQGVISPEDRFSFDSGT